MVETIFKLTIAGIVIAFVIGIIGSVAFGWSLDTSPYLKGLTSFLNVIYYIVPIKKLSPLIFIFISTMLFRIVVSIISTIWDLIPGKNL